MKSQPKNKSSQPVHLHIQENTPVYVHLIPEKDGQSDTEILKSGSIPGTFLNPPSPRKEPWIPPPAKTSKKEKEKNIPLIVPKKKKQPLASDIEEGNLLLHFQTMSVPDLNVGRESTHDVGTLTDLSAGTVPSFIRQDLSEKELAFDAVEQVQDKPSLTRKEGEDEIVRLRDELDMIEKRCQLLFSSLHFVRSQNQIKSPPEKRQDNEQHLTKDLKKMTSKVELQARESAATVGVLMDLVENIQKETKGSWDWKSKLNYLYKEKEELLNKLLTAFETNNVVLRTIIESQQCDTYTSQSNKEQSSRSDALYESIEKLQSSLAEKDQHISSLERDLNAYKDQASSFENTKSYLEQTRTQMQRELHNKEAQLERLQVHLQKLQNNIPDGSKEIQRLTVLLEQAHDKARAEKEALKKAVRAQQQKAEQNEETITQLKKALEKNKRLVTQLIAERDQWKATVTEEMNKEIKAKAEQTTLENKVETLEKTLKNVELAHQEKIKDLTTSLEAKGSQLSILTMENEKLKGILEQEKQSSDLNKRHSPFLFPPQERQTSATLISLPYDQETVHSMIDDLKTQLIETKEVNLILREQLKEAAIQISDLTLKLGQQGEQIVFLKESPATEAKNNKINTQSETASDRALQDHTKREEESICCLKLRLQEKQEEVHRLENILKQLQEDSQRQTEELKKQYEKQEQYWQNKISKLDHEMEARKLEQEKLLKEKDEVEYKLRRKVEDVQDSLLQAQSSNQSLQKYVQFLKNSYASVFGESSKWGTEALQ